MNINSFNDRKGNFISKGDRYFYIDEKHRVLTDVFENSIEGLAQFKFESDAEYFSIMNNPILSIQDIVDKYFGKISIGDLQTLVKQKLLKKDKLKLTIEK